MVPHLNLFLQLDSYRVSIGVVDKELLFISFLISAFLLYLKMFIFALIEKRYSTEFTKRESSVSLIAKLFLVVTTCVCLTVYYVYLQNINKVALFVALAGDVEQSKQARSAMVNEFGSGHRWNSLFYKSILTFIIFYC